MREVVVVGAGAAGLTAAETLRRHGYAGRLRIVGAESHLPYDRPPLSKQVLAGTWEPHRLTLRHEPELTALGAEFHLGTRATGLDPSAGRLRLSDGDVLPYDGLVIATGVQPRRLRTGHGLVGVHVLRTIDDTLALRTELRSRPTVVVVGAGFLGAEVAAVARQMGLSVTLVDPLTAPMIRQVGPDVGAMITRLHRDHGTTVRMGVAVAHLIGDCGRVVGVMLADGDVLPADVVVVAIGSTPTHGWLRDSGLRLTDGVDGDAHCQVAPRIVAAGDVASWMHPTLHRRVRVEHRMSAGEQAGVAAKTLLGIKDTFAPLPYFWSDQYETKIQVYGAWPASAEMAVVAGDLGIGRFAALYGWRGTVVGALGWNAPRQLSRLCQHVIDRTGWPDAVQLTGDL